MQKCGDLVLGQPPPPPPSKKQKLDSTEKKILKRSDKLYDVNYRQCTFIQSWTSRRPWLRYERATNMMFCDMRIKHDALT